MIHEDHIGESLRVYANENHKWYFLDNQAPTQVALFRNIHSDGLKVPCTYASSCWPLGADPFLISPAVGVHLALPNPFQDEDESDRVPRESIEMRMVRFFS